MSKCPFADGACVRCSKASHPMFGGIFYVKNGGLSQFTGQGWAEAVAADPSLKWTNDSRCDTMRRCARGKPVIGSGAQYLALAGLAGKSRAATGPRLYVGSAFLPASDALAKRPESWPVVRAASGMHVHPMGYVPRMDKAGLMAQFGHKKFTLEEDLNNAWVVSRASGMTWIRHVQAAAPGWECTGFMPNVMTDVLYNDPRGTAANFEAYFADCKAAGIPCFVLFSPVSGEAVRVGLDRLLDQKVDGVWVPIWVARKTGAVGIAIDYPAMHYGGRQMAPATYRAVGHAVARRAKDAGLKFAWMLNGASTPDETQAAAQDIAANGIVPDMWVMSGFQDEFIRAVPENGYTLTGQAKPIVSGGF